MAKCINIKSKEYKALLAITGLTPLELYSKVSRWQEANNTDEFPSPALLGVSTSVDATVEALFLIDPNYAELIMSALNFPTSEVTYTDENNDPCAAQGLRSDFTHGSQWEIVDDLTGYPSHSRGGVDVMINNNGVQLSSNNSNIKAKYGLILPNN